MRTYPPPNKDPMKATVPVLLLVFLPAAFSSLVSAPPGKASPARMRYDHGDPTPCEQLMLEMINRARADPTAEAARLGIQLNKGLEAGAISSSPKPPLAFHPKLTAAARGHTRWMLSAGRFSHTGAEGSDPRKRVAAAGYEFSQSWSQAENIGFGGTVGTPDLPTETAARHDALFQSPEHRKNICGPDFREIGLGLMAGRFKGGNAVLVTQNFAKGGTGPSPLVTGVVFEDRDGDGFYDPGEGMAGVTVVPEGGNWEAVTSASGGYAVPYDSTAAGTLTVTFQSGPLRGAVQRSVTRTGGNVKVDLLRKP
ncbi:MAG: hypothetical protein EOP86_10095 [Verrucomicrobiaceae bacterium]|nr:MAG: hypothetical protein EOP86_10095 [Verrucomicrobiaceae bacterium]